MSSEHWIASAVRDSLKQDTPPLALTAGAGIAESWSMACTALTLSPDRLAHIIADYFQLERADLTKLDIDFARQVPENVARSHLVLPIISNANRALIATADPTDTLILDELAFTLGMPVDSCIAPPAEIEAKLAEVYASETTPSQHWGSMPRSVAGAELSIRRKDGSTLDTGTSGTAKLFREVLRMAIHINASDAHIQPYGTGAVVRNRVDGVLHTTIDLPRKVHDHLVRHVKAISGMDPTRSFVPQDGELSVEVEHKYTDLRLSIVPLDSGERLVMRLLPQSQVKSLDNLQLAAHEMQRMRTMATASAGLILVTGPTGSGKTSLMYAMLAEINTPDINIMTVEQPVEYRLRGASQINVDTRQGLTFALALRSILRQDPDVVMVGEIRDEETATIAAQAALTGHLVLSTVHTLDGLSSLSRMEDLGVTPNTLSNALQAIVAQRLVRKLCLQCRTVRQPQDLSADEQQYAALRAAPAWQSIGCDACNGTGYWGRAPVVEVIEITGQLQTALRAGERDLARLEVLAAATGTRFLSESFADRVDEGTTTVAEVLRVYGRGFFTRLKQHNNLRIAQLAHAAKRQSETDLAIT